MSVVFHDNFASSTPFTLGANTTTAGNNGMFGTLGASTSLHVNFSGSAYVFEGAECNLGAAATVFQYYIRPSSGITVGNGCTIFTAFTSNSYTTNTAPGRLDITPSGSDFKLEFVDPSNSYSSVTGSTLIVPGTAYKIVMYQTSAGWKVYLNNSPTAEITYTHTQGTVGLQYIALGTVYENASGSTSGVLDFGELWCGNLASAPSTATQKAADAYQGYLQNHLAVSGQPYRGAVDGDNLSSVATIDTVSEGAAYLLRLAVQQNDQTSFILCDNWILNNLLRSNSTSGNTQNNAAPANALNLMCFHYNSANTDGKGIGTIYDGNWSGDAEADRMQALFWAHGRWGSSAYTVGTTNELVTPNYSQRAKNVESDLYNYAFVNSTTTGYNYLVTDSFQQGNLTVQIAPDYNNPAAYHLAAQYVTAHASFWNLAISGVYDIIQKTATTIFTGQTVQVGLNSDWVAFVVATGTVSTTASTYGDFNYGFNAFRASYRLYDTYTFYGDSGALTALQEPKSFFTSQWSSHSEIYATFNHDGTNPAAYEATYFTYPAYWSIYANDTGNATASAINSAKLSSLYYQEPYGSIISEAPSSAQYGYFGQSWTLVGYMQQNGLWLDYGESVAIAQVGATITATGGTQAVGTVNISAISQTHATLTITGGTQSVSTVQDTSISQSAATLTATGGTQSVSVGGTVSVAQSAANITATGGTQTVASVQDVSLTQSHATLTAQGGTQVVSTVQDVSVTQVGATLTMTGGTQSIATVNDVAISQSGGSITASGGTQSIASVRIVAVAQSAASVTASGGTQSVSTGGSVAVTQAAATLTATGGTQSVASIQDVSVSQSHATLTATGGTQTVVAVVEVSASVTQIYATLIATGGNQSLSAQIDASIAQRGASITATGGTQIVVAVIIVNKTTTWTPEIIYPASWTSVGDPNPDTWLVNPQGPIDTWDDANRTWDSDYTWDGIISQATDAIVSTWTEV